jgi:hypothetical protein
MMSGCKAQSIKQAFLCAAVTLSVGVSAWLMLRRMKGRRTGKVTVPEGYTKLDLHEIENYRVEEPPVGSQTFLRGNIAESERYVRTRFRAIVKANPWLAGRVARDDDGSLVILYPTHVSDELAESLVQEAPAGLHAELLAHSPEALHSSTPSSIPCGPGVVGCLQSQAPLARVVLVPCRRDDASRQQNGGADFALFFFMSHILGGASTHYRLLGMLNETEQVSYPLCDVNARPSRRSPSG